VRQLQDVINNITSRLFNHLWKLGNI